MTDLSHQFSDEQLFAQALVRMQTEAQQSLSKFYSMVMKEENTKEPLTPSPHQELIFDFIEAHPWCVVRIPVSTSKTFMMAALALWLMGNEPSERWAVVSGSQAQAKKIIKMCSDYITQPELSEDLALVFPKMGKSTNPNDPWSQNQITIERPAGIRDPSMVAIGIDGKIVGSRISGLLADDLLDFQNTRTKESREKVLSNFYGAIVPRLDPKGSRAIVTNTPWHEGDLTFRLEKDYGWPTITMDIYGFIRLSNVSAAWMAHALDVHIRPSQTRIGDGFDWYRLRAYDPDPEETTPLWSARFPAEKIAELRYGKDGKAATPPFEFACTYLCSPLSEDSARCQRGWIESAKLRGMGKHFLTEYHGDNLVATGVDLAMGKKSHNDQTVFFTIMITPQGDRQIIDIQSGKFSGPAIVDILIDKADRYGSIIAVEDNAAQSYIKEFAGEKRKDIRIHAHTTTGVNKWAMDYGVESIFSEIQNGAWIIPCEAGTAQVHPETQRFIDNCLYYQPPPAHTGDWLMAAWFAREAVRKRFGGSAPPTVGAVRQLVKGGGF